MGTVTVSKEGKITPPPNPTKEGYIFDGWYKEPECVNEWNFETDTATPGMRLYAKWVPVSEGVIVTFNTRGGSAVPSVTVAPGQKISAPQNPTKEGYHFNGWFKDANCTQEWNFETETVNSNITLYAGWIANVIYVEVAFDSRGGSFGIMKVSLNKGETVSPPPTPWKEGYIFGGWYKEPECINEWVFAVDLVNTDITLYAKWVTPPPMLFTVTFNTQG